MEGSAFDQTVDEDIVQLAGLTVLLVESVSLVEVVEPDCASAIWCVILGGADSLMLSKVAAETRRILLKFLALQVCWCWKESLLL